MDTIQRCRDLLQDLTPLHGDCGLYCGGICCRSHEGQDTGMLLFPGEESLYEGQPRFRILDASGDRLLICQGSCERQLRPLSCRIFPLLPLVREDGIKIATDARAAGTCPLRRDDMNPAFIQAVRTCGQWLYADEQQRPFLVRLTAIHDELKQLRNTFHL